MSGIDNNILIDLRGAYAANVASLPEIETAINQLLKAAGRTVGVTVLRDNLELVYAANVLNLLSAIQAGGEEGECLRNTFLKMAAPERDVPSPDLSKLRKYSDSTQDLFTWLVNYRRQPSFDQGKLTALLAQVDAIQTLVAALNWDDRAGVWRRLQPFWRRPEIRRRPGDRAYVLFRRGCLCACRFCPHQANLPRRARQSTHPVFGKLMAKCLRCGADNEGIEGDPPKRGAKSVTAETDLAFLEEMRERFDRARDGMDSTQYDMVRQMMTDWIDELR